MDKYEIKICSYSKQCTELIKSLKLKDEKDIMKWQLLNNRHIQNLILNYIGFTPKTKEELQKAIKLWCDNKKVAIKKFEDINTWNVQNITDMSELFKDCYNFNDNINNWNVSNVINMNSMFVYCYKFNQPLNNWDVSNVTNMNNMFRNCYKFNQPLNNWDVSNVKIMFCMFSDCEKFNQPLDNWNVSNVTDMSWMFQNCKKFNQPLNNWYNLDTDFHKDKTRSKLVSKNNVNMIGMFQQCENLLETPKWYTF